MCLSASPWAAIAVGAPTLVEAGIVLSACDGQDASAVLIELLAVADAVVIEFGPGHWRVAVSDMGAIREGPAPRRTSRTANSNSAKTAKVGWFSSPSGC